MEEYHKGLLKTLFFIHQKKERPGQGWTEYQAYQASLRGQTHVQAEL